MTTTSDKPDNEFSGYMDITPFNDEINAAATISEGVDTIKSDIKETSLLTGDTKFAKCLCLEDYRMVRSELLVKNGGPNPSFLKRQKNLDDRSEKIVGYLKDTLCRTFSYEPNKGYLFDLQPVSD